jgi:hypothetical protein
MNSIETNPEILEARKKLAEKFGNVKIGGKGKIECVKLTIFVFRLPEKKGGSQAQVFRRPGQENSVVSQESP